MPCIVQWPIKQNVVVGSGLLQDRLTAGDIGIQRWQIMPDGVTGIQLCRRIEQPARPLDVGGTVRGAVVDDVVDTREHLAIDHFLDLR